MRKIKNFISELLIDERDKVSAKRFVGIMLSIGLFISLVVTSFTNKEIEPPQYLVQSAALLIFGCLGLTSVDKYIGKKNNQK